MDTTPKKVLILGSTGSIGRQAIDVMRSLGERVAIVGLVAGGDRDGIESQARSLGVEVARLGEEAAVELAATSEADVVLNAIVGAAGLRASVAALEAGKTLALANKESLVAGGEACLAAAASGGGHIVPVDSEHAAIAQCLEGRDVQDVKRMVLTASGGPFRTRRVLDDVTPAEALDHPTWSMGRKISVDSATLMNKGLELIEAHFLFGIDFDRLGVLVHPQSVVHGLVELIDGTLIMQAAPTDMRIPIQSALLWPERAPAEFGRLDLAGISSLGFEEVDHTRFPAIGVALRAGAAGKTYPAVLNAANEVAVETFLSGRLRFVDIARVVDEVLDTHAPAASATLEDVLAADGWARAEARRITEGAPV